MRVVIVPFILQPSKERFINNTILNENIKLSLKLFSEIQRRMSGSLESKRRGSDHLVAVRRGSDQLVAVRRGSDNLGGGRRGSERRGSIFEELGKVIRGRQSRNSVDSGASSCSEPRSSSYRYTYLYSTVQ